MGLIGNIRKWLAAKFEDRKRVNKTPEPMSVKSEGPSVEKPTEEEIRISPEIVEPAAVSTETPIQPPRGSKRAPYFIQVGLDFGTTYCKCVCRDVIANKAWVYVPPHPADRERPFLIPSALQVADKKLCVGDPAALYHSKGLPHVKMALAKAALKEWDDPALFPFVEILGRRNRSRVDSFVAACAVYLLAGVLGDVRRDIGRRFPSFGERPEDYMAVNMAIPVANAEKGQVNALFQAVLENAVLHADKLVGHPVLPLRDVAQYVPHRPGSKSGAEGAQNGRCFMYPEVSASVQGFVRSRVSRGGIYLFSDTGAATVDQSVFILRRRRAMDQEPDQLTYLYASVLPLGSSQIERIAALKAGDTTPHNLERWRKRKETGETASELYHACWEVGERLEEETVETLYKARMKLFVREQLNDTRVLFGGGGHVKNPYETAVLRGFKDERVFGKKRVEPSVLGMPLPRDLEPRDALERWMPRLWVAYGLSFLRDELVPYIYPSDVPRPLPEYIRPRKRVIIDAPSKDEV